MLESFRSRDVIRPGCHSLYRTRIRMVSRVRHASSSARKEAGEFILRSRNRSSIVPVLGREGFSFECMCPEVRVFRARVPEAHGGNREWFLELSSAHRQPRALSRNPAARDRRFTEKFPAADVCPVRQRYFFAKARPWSAQSSGESAFHAHGEVELAVNLP